MSETPARRRRLSAGGEAARRACAARAARALDEITLESVVAGEVKMEDLRITPAALQHQAEIARAAGRPTLAAKFRAGGGNGGVPQDVIMQVYELLRPGRAKGKEELMTAAQKSARDPWHAAAGRFHRGGGEGL